ncbi:hypothetical protein BJY52DRAFT_1229592 [Lactarius psammicola]|nr:hypothetical protein BJY52DRAFT_1229592 [Lactarius psammicola]
MKDTDGVVLTGKAPCRDVRYSPPAAQVNEKVVQTLKLRPQGLKLKSDTVLWLSKDVNTRGVKETVCDTRQNQQSFSIDANSSILTNGQSIGLALTVEASFLSFSAVIVILILIAPCRTA